MNRKLLGTAAALLLIAGSAMAAEQGAARDRSMTQGGPGRAMMTDQERDEQRAKMRGAASGEEREKIRAEHHQKMKQRAEERGETLPDAPRQGMGGGRGPGGGQGMGGGRGPGGGQGMGR